MDMVKQTEFEVIMKDIEHIKEWIAKQPHLPQEYDDGWLETFLFGCKFSIERCKKMLDAFYTSRSLFPEYFTNRDPTTNEIRSISKKQLRYCLPQYLENGHAVFITDINDPDISSFFCQDEFKRLMMIRDIAILKHNFDIILILEAKNFTSAHLPTFICKLKLLLSLILDASPLRAKQIHVVNVNSFAKSAYSAVLPFLKEKLRKRIHIYGSDLQCLYEHVPRKILPIEYGGEAGTMKDLNNAWQETLESYKDWFLSDEKRKTDESKRVKYDLNNDLFGVEGSFKKLSID